MIVSCSLNGEILPPGKEMIFINDLGLLRGFGIFDFCRTSAGKPFLLKQHIVRFRRSAGLIGMALTFTDEQITYLVNELLSRSGLQHAGIRIVLTGGYSPDGITMAVPNLIITVEQLNLVTNHAVQEGVKLMSYAYQREMPEIKTTNYLMAIHLQKEQREKQAYDILYYHQGKALELTRSNFFIVRGKTIITPKNNILKGITRANIIQLARQQYTVEEREVAMDEVKQADEAFLTGTNKKIVPVVKIDDLLIGTGKAGTVTRSLIAAFDTFEKEYII
jgi:branched-subunit amino acid aminotransferase/4-amino-4-deoxychorismate lyase